jgi:hypothetical protein
MEPLPTDASVLEAELTDALAEARSAVAALKGTSSLAEAESMVAELVAMRHAFSAWSTAPPGPREQVRGRIQFLSERAKALQRI